MTSDSWIADIQPLHQTDTLLLLIKLISSIHANAPPYLNGASATTTRTNKQTYVCTNTIRNESIPNVRHINKYELCLLGKWTEHTYTYMIPIPATPSLHLSLIRSTVAAAAFPAQCVNQSNYIIISQWWDCLTFNSCVQSRASSTVDTYLFQIWQIWFEKLLFTCVTYLYTFTCSRNANFQWMVEGDETHTYTLARRRFSHDFVFQFYHHVFWSSSSNLSNLHGSQYFILTKRLARLFVVSWNNVENNSTQINQNKHFLNEIFAGIVAKEEEEVYN